MYLMELKLLWHIRVKMFKIKPDSVYIPSIKEVKYFEQKLWVPEHIQWLATNFYGHVHGFVYKPVAVTESKNYDKGFWIGSPVEYITVLSYEGNWEESLQYMGD